MLYILKELGVANERLYELAAWGCVLGRFEPLLGFLKSGGGVD